MILTVAITAHREKMLIVPTLRSISKALEVFLRSYPSTKVEVLLTLDRSDDITDRIVTSHLEMLNQYATTSVFRTNFGEAGAARNFAAENAKGEFVCFCDGDDLISSNYLQVAFEVLESNESQKIIVHPEKLVTFGKSSSIWQVKASNKSEAQALDILQANPWPSSSMSRKKNYIQVPYRSLSPNSGFGPEDWTWNIDTSSKGYIHTTAPGTIFFYRDK